jgi:hypothetical protein
VNTIDQALLVMEPTLEVCDRCDCVIHGTEWPMAVLTANGCFVCPTCDEELTAAGAQLNPAWVEAGKHAHCELLLKPGCFDVLRIRP